MIDKLPPNSWVALTPDRKLVAGVGATQEEAAQNAKSDYGLLNPILVTLLKLKPGKHQVQIVLQGYKDWLMDVEVKADSIVNVTAKLEK